MHCPYCPDLLELAGKDRWLKQQLELLKEAFRQDVHQLAARVEELRQEALHANVYAKASTKLLGEQNQLLKERLGHNAMVAAQRQRRLRAWIGWKLAVVQGRSRLEASEHRQMEMADRESMIGHLEEKLRDARAASTYIHAYIHAHIHTYMHTYMHAYIQVCIHAYIGHLEEKLRDGRSKHSQQLRSLQETHVAEMLERRSELEAAHESLARLKTFSAHKLREMAEQVERAQQRQRQQQSQQQQSQQQQSQQQQSQQQQSQQQQSQQQGGSRQQAAGSRQGVGGGGGWQLGWEEEEADLSGGQTATDGKGEVRQT